jgi:hypothetical protein
MNNIQKSNILHKGIFALRSNLSARHQSTINNFLDAKVLFVSHSEDVFEFKLNNPKTLNAVDFEMLSLLEQ